MIYCFFIGILLLHCIFYVHIAQGQFIWIWSMKQLRGDV